MLTALRWAMYWANVTHWCRCAIKENRKKMVANALFYTFKQSHCELIVEQFLLTTTTENVRGTVWIMCNLRIHSIKEHFKNMIDVPGEQTFYHL